MLVRRPRNQRTILTRVNKYIQRVQQHGPSRPRQNTPVLIELLLYMLYNYTLQQRVLPAGGANGSSPSIPDVLLNYYHIHKWDFRVNYETRRLDYG